LSTRVHCGVPLHEFSPAQRFVSAGLEGEVGEVIGGEPKTLLCWVCPQHADDDVVREASDEGLASRSSHEDTGARWLAKGTTGDRLHQPGVDKAEGAEAQGDPGSLRDPATIHPIRRVRRDTRCAPTWCQLSGFATAGSKFLLIVRGSDG
jgi:hypothetical protein